jgi:Mce-associated membrane protein
MNRLHRLAAPSAAVLLGVTVWQGLGWREDRSVAEDRRAVLRVAEAQGVDLLSLTASNVSERLTAMSERTTGDFKRQLDGITSTFAGTITDQKIEAAGQVVDAAVESLDEDDAKVLLAGDTQVKDDKSDAVTPRSYRIRVSLVRHEGRWLIDNMEFVR